MALPDRASRSAPSAAGLTRQTAGRWLFALTVAGAALAVGSQPPVAVAGVAIGFAASSALLWWDAEAVRSREAAAVLVCLSVALTLFTLLQMVPLPAPLVARLSPHAADVWARALTPLGEVGPSWHSLSLDPTGTRIELLRGVAYTLALTAALKIGATRGGLLFLSRVILASVVVVVLVTVTHSAVGAERVFGLYAPKTGTGSVGPLMNANHLAAYVNIGVMVAVGGTFAARPPAHRVLIGTLALALCGVEVWLASRGGVGAMILGLALLGGWYARKSGGAGPQRFFWLGGIAIVVIAVGALVLLAFEESMSQLRDTDLSKLSVNLDCFRKMVPAYPAFGAGRGAFESTYPEFRTSGGYVVFTHAENFLSQWAAEWGAPVTALATAALAHAMRPRLALVRGDAALGFWVAVLVVGAQNLVDFSSEVPGVVVAVITCAAAAAAGVSGDTTGGGVFRRLRGWSMRPRFIAVAGVVGVVGAAAVAVPAAAHELLSDLGAMRALSADARTADSHFRDEVRAAMLRHPAEPYFPYLGSVRVLVTGRGSIVPWAARTLERAPVFAPAHLTLGRWMAARAPSQARLEYRLAIEQGGVVINDEFIPLIHSFDEAMEVTPAGGLGVSRLDAIAVALDERLPSTRWRVDAEILSREPGHVRASRRLARDALQDLEAGESASWCAARGCERAAMDAAGRCERNEPAVSYGRVMRARSRAALGDAAAIDGLREACVLVLDRAACMTALAQIAIDLKRDAEATLAIDELVRSPCAGPSECASVLLTAVSLEDARGNTNRALVFARRAVHATPEGATVLEALASHAVLAGLHREASDAYGRLLRIGPATPRLRELAAREAQALRDEPPR